jgi:hypothetical protein
MTPATLAAATSAMTPMDETRAKGASRAGGRLLVAAVLGLGLCDLLLGCGGGGGGSPVEPAHRFFLLDRGVMTNDSGCCLQEVQIVLDGVALTTYNFPQAPGSLTWDLNVDALGRTHEVPIEPGQHDIVVRIVRDAQAPGNYTAGTDIEVRDQNGARVMRVTLAQRGHFRSGDGPTFAFSF